MSCPRTCVAGEVAHTPPGRHRELIDELRRYCRQDILSLAAVYRAMELGLAVTLEELGERPTQVSSLIFSAARASTVESRERSK